MTQTQVTEQQLLDSFVGNQDDACTSAAVLNGLGALGAKSLPNLASASSLISGVGPLQPPRIADYIGIPFLRRAPIDSRIERLAAECGINVTSITRLAPIPSRALPIESHMTMPGPGEILIGHMAYGQERPGFWGWWGLKPFQPSSWSAAGHSVIVAASEGRGWAVVDSNNLGIQHWRRPGWAMANTRIQLH